MDSVHWLERACCVASMLLGVASVTTATKQHHAFGMLRSPLDARLWLSRGRPTPYHQIHNLENMHEKLASALESLNMPVVNKFMQRYYDKTHNLHEARQRWLPDRYANIEAFRDLPLESSVSGLKAVALPRHLLDLAVILFTIGSGLYELFCWKSNDGEDSISYRNMFVVLIITVGLYVTYDMVVSAARIFDQDKRNLGVRDKHSGTMSKAR